MPQLAQLTCRKLIYPILLTPSVSSSAGMIICFVALLMFPLYFSLEDFPTFKYCSRVVHTIIYIYIYSFRLLIGLCCDVVFLQLQHLRDSGQASDPRYKTILSFLQAQQAAGNNQGVASIGGSTGGGPSGSLPSSIQQRFQQDGNSRSSGDSQTTSLGNSDSSRGSQSHSQAAYLQQALLSAQQKAQATAYSQQKVTKPLQTGPTRDFNSANNLNMQVRACTSIFPDLNSFYFNLYSILAVLRRKG